MLQPYRNHRVLVLHHDGWHERPWSIHTPRGWKVLKELKLYQITRQYPSCEQNIRQVMMAICQWISTLVVVIHILSKSNFPVTKTVYF
jgi:hypothetical protein